MAELPEIHLGAPKYLRNLLPTIKRPKSCKPSTRNTDFRYQSSWRGICPNPAPITYKLLVQANCLSYSHWVGTRVKQDIHKHINGCTPPDIMNSAEASSFLPRFVYKKCKHSLPLPQQLLLSWICQASPFQKMPFFLTHSSNNHKGTTYFYRWDKGMDIKQMGPKADQAVGLLLLCLSLVMHSLSEKVSWLGIHLLHLYLGAQAKNIWQSDAHPTWHCLPVCLAVALSSLV